MNSKLAPLKVTLADDEPSSSLELLYSGEADEFITAIQREVTQHPALHHPLLTKLSAGTFYDTKAILRDYANQYSFYNAWFTRYLDGVIKNLDKPSYQQTLVENMQEECGNPHSPKLEERPHTEIFEVFKKSVGVDEAFKKSCPPCTTVLLWRDLFLQKCKSPIKGVGIGAIGLGTEFTISIFYPYIIDAIEKHTDLDGDASLFFRLHTECDQKHADTLISLTTEIAEDISCREAIRFGVFSSLNLRKAFWDAQLARAGYLF